MLGRPWEIFRPHPGRELIAVFAATILVPGILLAVFAFRALEQERRLADQQIRERLDRAAERAAHDLEEQLHRWQRAAVEFTPEFAERTFSEPGSGAAIVIEKRRPRVFPPWQILYDLSPEETEPRPLPPAFAAAETEELRRKDYAKAAALYQQAMNAMPPDLRPLALHRVARIYQRQGRRPEAIRAYLQLKAATELRIAGVPADLIARYELCSLIPDQTRARELYRDLVSGRWQIEKSRYMFYSEAVQSRLAGDREAAPWSEIEQRKAVLTHAVESAISSAAPVEAVPADNGVHLVFSAGATRLVLSASFLKRAVWPRALASLAADGLEAALVGPNGRAVFGPAPVHAGPSSVRPIDENGLSWRLTVWPRDPAAFHAGLARRQGLYLAMLVLVVALLIFGGYFTLRAVRRELEVARMKSHFVSAVSHEFRSPLTGIRQLGEMLMRGRVPSEQRRQEYYQLITQESDRLTRLVENVLDFSRMEEGRKEYRFARFDTADWLRRVVTEFQAGVTEKGMEVSATVPAELPPIFGDREALSCAVQNLLDNAVKYSPDSKTVWLEAEASNGRLSIRIRDRGVGIADEDKKQIFEKFYRGGGETARKVKGVGLGLSLVKHIVSAHDGTVEFTSRAGEGSTFCIHLKASEKS